MRTFTAAEREFFQSRLPEGATLAEIRTATCRASLEVLDGTEAEIAAAMDRYRLAANDPFNVDGTPKVMKVVTWMAHAEVVNRNGDYFVAEELQEVVPTLWRLPNPGVMDWNHSAVLPNKGPKVIGFWYKADWAFDETANEGKGAWGIIATGLMFAWAFPEIAAKMLAKQEEQGFVDYSACWIPAVRETRKGGPKGKYVVSHNPTFFTLSALDVAPAFPDAHGPATLDPAVTDEDLRAAIETTATATAAQVQEEGTMTKKADTENTAAPAAEPAVTPEVPVVATEIPAETPAEVPAETPVVAELVMVEKTVVNTTRTEEVDGKPTYEQVIEQLTTYRTTIAELQAANETLTTQASSAATKVTEYEAEIADLKSKLAGFEAEKAAQAQQAVLASRIAALPAEFVKAFDKKDPEVKAKAHARWAKMTDEEWVEHMELLNISPTSMKVGYVERSAAEGDLPAGRQIDGSAVDSAISRHLKK